MLLDLRHVSLGSVCRLATPRPLPHPQFITPLSQPLITYAYADTQKSLPLVFYLRLFKPQISSRERLLAYFLITISSVLSVIGTVWAFLPKSLIGAV